LKFDGMVFSVVIGWVVAMRNELMIGSMRFSCIRRAALPVLLILSLTACGGSDDPRNDLDLYSAYELIDAGMCLVQVKAVVGHEPHSSQADGPEHVLHTWEADADNYRHTRLFVTIEDEVGVVRKTVSGYRGNETQVY